MNNSLTFKFDNIIKYIIIATNTKLILLNSNCPCCLYFVRSIKYVQTPVKQLSFIRNDNSTISNTFQNGQSRILYHNYIYIYYV